ncbi:hypothetical protein, partial [Escherichia coli]|uniref:hypothetical protein n=1 Tax=Escherichia coli TaxID=562 RepID=UPI003BA027C3
PVVGIISPEYGTIPDDGANRKAAIKECVGDFNTIQFGELSTLVPWGTHKELHVRQAYIDYRFPRLGRWVDWLPESVINQKYHSLSL